MRTIPAALATELTAPDLSLCRIVAITRKDGTVIRFAEAQSALTVGGATYPAARGIRMSSIPFELNGSRSTVDFEITATDGGIIDPDDLRNGLYTSASVLISACSQANPLNGKVDLFRGLMGEVEINDRGLAKLECLGLLSKARAIPVENYIPTCLAFFGDGRCKKDLGPLTVTTTITAISGFDITVAASVAAEYRLGLLVPTTGNGKGDAFEVREASGNVLSMFLPTSGKLAVGDSVQITPGCDFTYDGAQGCTFWANQVNFRGFKDIPGADALNITYSDWGAS